MCLRELHKTIPEKYDGVTTGYKVFGYNISGKLCPADRVDLRFKGYPINKWIKDTEEYELLTDEKQPYQTGFHIFLDRESAYSYCNDDEKVCTVEFRNPTAWGTQGYFRMNVVVAREMKILGN